MVKKLVPLLDLVLSKQYSFPHSEERRLFYVAVTRAKKRGLFDSKQTLSITVYS